jgi:3-carboxy-cis,cis-muconate cycloisomerase
MADLFMLLDNSLSMALETIKGLRVDPVAMQANLARLHGVIHSERASMLLGRTLGAAAAQRIVDEACRQSLKDGAEFAELLQRHPDVQGKVDAAAIETACAIEPCLDAAELQCAPVFAAWAAQRTVLADVSRAGG